MSKHFHFCVILRKTHKIIVNQVLKLGKKLRDSEFVNFFEDEQSYVYQVL